jgi:TnpA family transposase
MEPAEYAYSKSKNTNHSDFSIPNDDLIRYWTLQENELDLLTQIRGQENKQYFAFQICHLKKVGAFLRAEETPNHRVLIWINKQLGFPAEFAWASSMRGATKHDYRKVILEHLHWKEFEEEEKTILSNWITSRVKCGDSRSEMISNAPFELFKLKIVRPSRSELDRFVSTEILNAEDQLFEMVARAIPKRAAKDILSLIAPKSSDDTARFFSWIEPPIDARADYIVAWLHREAEYRNIGVGKIDLSHFLSRKRIEELSLSARKYSQWELCRFSEPKRLTLLACFLVDSYAKLLDSIIEMHDKFMTIFYRKSMRSLEKKLTVSRKKSQKYRKIILSAARLVAEHQGEDLLVARAKIDISALKNAIEEVEKFEVLEEVGANKEYSNRSGKFKQYFRLFLWLDFQAAPGHENIKTAIEYARSLSGIKKSWLPEDCPHDFIPNINLKSMTNQAGKIKRTLWEVHLAFEIQTRLRARDLFLSAAKRHNNFWDAIKPPSAGDTNEVFIDFKTAMDRLKNEHATEFQTLKATFKSNPFVYLQDKIFKVRKEPSRRPAKSGKLSLKEIIVSELGKQRIESVLSEIDKYTGFSGVFTHHGSGECLSPERRHVLHASLVAHATNLGIMGMASATEGITADMISDLSKAYLTPDNLRAAQKKVIDFQSTLQSGNVWGDGTFSSSDGQRFALQGSSLIADYHPRYFGSNQKGFSVYTHVSDRYTVFHSQAISCLQREWVAVLDGLLRNDTSIQPRFHTTDTHGYTDHMFALCWLLGFTFAPRIKDVAATQIYRLKGDEYGDFDKVFFETPIRFELIAEQWQLILNLTAALRGQLIEAHTVCTKLSANTSDRFSQALMELGRLVKTIFVLRYLHDSDLRGAIQLQLNKGESRHELARNVCFANRGEFRSGDLDELMNKTTCLAFVCNAIVTWNTLEIGEILEQLRVRGKTWDEMEASQVSPLLHEHIIRTGTYKFENLPSEVQA